MHTAPAAAVHLAASADGRSTTAFGLAVGLAVAMAVAMVVAARWPRGGWWRRFRVAGPLGLLAGLTEAWALSVAGFPVLWWLPPAGVALAAALPLTRRPVSVPAGHAPDTPWPGAPLGQWVLREVFSRTDTAVVWRAAAGDTTALVKVATAGRAGEPAVRLRLEHEAQLLAGHPDGHLVRLQDTLDSGTGPPTLVFEDVAGASLPRLLERSSLSGPQAVTVALGLLAGLRSLHERGLVHRQVRPEHVWLDGQGSVVLSNVELACAGVEHPLAPEADGSPYVSPEQADGTVLDARADLFAVAVLLAELLDPAPEPLAGVLARARAADPGQRPSSADEFAELLRAAAAAAYGADWAGRGALVAALTAHGAIGAAAAGYHLGGAAGAAIGTGSGALGTAGASEGALGSAGAGDGALGAGSVPAGAAATATAAACAAAVIIVGAVAPPAPAAPAGPPPAAAPTAAPATPDAPAPPGVPVIDPQEAEDILRAVLAEALTGGEAAPAGVARLFDEVEEVGDPTGVVVGVPCQHDSAPVWFVGTAEASTNDGEVQLMLRLEQDGADWSLTQFLWSDDEPLGSPQVGADGCLAPGPDPTDLVVEPERLPELYEVWLEMRFFHQGGIYTGPYAEPGRLFRPFLPEVTVVDRVRTFGRWHHDEDRLGSAHYDATIGDLDLHPVTLSDGSVLVTFPAEVDLSIYNGPDFGTLPCVGDGSGSAFLEPGPRGWGQAYLGPIESLHPRTLERAYRELHERYTVQVTVRVPTHAAADGVAWPVVVSDYGFDLSWSGVSC